MLYTLGKTVWELWIDDVPPETEEVPDTLQLLSTISFVTAVALHSLKLLQKLKNDCILEDCLALFRFVAED